MAESSTKSPAFQFYPADFLSDHLQVAMSAEEAGIYWRLVSHCWLSGSLPSDIPTLARLAGVAPRSMARAWTAVSRCFSASDCGGFTHKRLTRERERQQAFREKQAENGRKGGRPEKGLGSFGLTQTEAKTSSSSSSSSSKKKNTEASAVYAEPVETTGSALATSPTVLTFVTAGTTKSWLLTAAQVQGWAEAYPALDVLAECRKAQAWMAANPTRRKTAKGMTAFLVNWLNRSTDRPSSGPARVTSYGDKTTGNAAAFAAFLAKRQA